MKLFKSIFSPKSKEISKYEPNTLAEINESPDLRMVNEEEDVPEAPITKNAAGKKAQKPIKKEEAKSDKTKATPITSTQKTRTAKAGKTPASTSARSTKLSAAKPTETANKKTDSKANTKATAAKKVADNKASSTKKPLEKPTEKKSSSLPATAEKSTAKSAVVKANGNTKASDGKAKSAAKTSDKQQKVAEKSTPNKAIKSEKTAENKTKSVGKEQSSTKAKKAEEVKAEEPIQATTESKNSRVGKFEIKKSKDGRYVFNLYASNNVIVATSQVYTSSTSAMNGIKSVIANAPTAQVEDQTLKNVTAVPYPKWEIYRDKGEQYRFRLCASNGSCVCHSQGYTNKTNCKKGIESIIKFAADAEITKAYINKEK